MKVAIDLKAMTVAEKLELMEAIWADLDKEEIPSPAWHGDVLREREERLRRGEEKPIAWETAKRELLRDLK